MHENKQEDNINATGNKSENEEKKREVRELSPSFGPYLKSMREKKNKSLRGLEKDTGISASYIMKLERNDKKCPSLKVLESLANALEIDMNELLQVAGVQTDKSDEDNPSLQSIIFGKNIKIGDKVLNMQQKELMLKLMEKIGDLEWDNESKYRETIEVLELVDKFKKA